MTQYLLAAKGFTELEYDPETGAIHRWPIVAWRIEQDSPVPITVVGMPTHGFVWIESPDGLITHNDESPPFKSVDEWKRHMVDVCH